jgi:hypothetical protein
LILAPRFLAAGSRAKLIGFDSGGVISSSRNADREAAWPGVVAGVLGAALEAIGVVW